MQLCLLRLLLSACGYTRHLMRHSLIDCATVDFSGLQNERKLRMMWIILGNYGIPSDQHLSFRLLLDGTSVPERKKCCDSLEDHLRCHVTWWRSTVHARACRAIMKGWRHTHPAANHVDGGPRPPTIVPSSSLPLPLLQLLLSFPWQRRNKFYVTHCLNSLDI